MDTHPIRIVSLLLFLDSAGSAGGPILSEAMADPSAIADAQGEFLELGNPSADTLRLDSLRIEADGKSLSLSRVTLAPGAFFLICRDTVRAENGGMACHAAWTGLSLANARGTEVILVWSGGRNEYALPVPRSGMSWENTWEADGEYARFLPASASWAGGDLATPGVRNSRSSMLPSADLGIAGVAWEPRAAGGSPDGFLVVRVESRGSEIPPRFAIVLRLDADWDGEADSFLDSSETEMGPSGTEVLRFRLPPGTRGIVQARLGRDENPSNDGYDLPVEEAGILAITEWHPDPAEGGGPEWLEIRNRTADAGGRARRLDLGRASLNGVPLGSRTGWLAAGESMVLTQSEETFRARFGAVKVRVAALAGWPALRNTGDTLVLSLSGFTVDSLAYGADGSASDGRAAAAGFSPGFAGEAAPEPGWKLSGRVASPIRPLDVEVAATGNYRLRVFDLEGVCVRDLGGGGPGRRRHSWRGEGVRGGSVRPGPYILCLSMYGGRGNRREVVVADTE